MSITVRCPCCNQLWKAAPADRLPVFAVKDLAFAFVERETGLTSAQLRSSRRSANFTAARALLVWIARTYCPAEASYPRIGRWLEKDHTSILHLWNEIVPRLRTNDANFTVRCARFAEFAAKAKETLQ